MPMPGRLKNPPPAGVLIPGLPGWVIVRLNGCAAFGAVDVVGGAEKVRVPREPELEPPPTRASADEATMTSGIATDKTTASACTKPKARCLKFMAIFLKNLCSPWILLRRSGKRPLDVQRRSKEKPQRGGWAAARRRGDRYLQLTVNLTDSLRSHRFLHRGHKLAQREGLWQESELLILRQALLEGIFRVTRNEDDLQIGILPAHGL